LSILQKSLFKLEPVEAAMLVFAMKFKSTKAGQMVAMAVAVVMLFFWRPKVLIP